MNLIPHTAWNVQDSTKLQNFMDCPRSYFYEYVLGWRQENPNVHLEFGKAWHYAMEHLILCHGRDGEYKPQAVADAYDLFMNHYRKHFSEQMDDVTAPKNPSNALKALAGYSKEYAGEKYEPLYTEVAGTVPIGEDKVLHFRMDSIIRTADGIRSREHKTGSQLSRPWTDQWALKNQTRTYNHVLYCLFPEEEVWGIEINGVIFNKTKTQYIRVPCRQSKAMMRVWFWNVNHWFNLIKWEFERLAECKETDDVLMCFPMNTESCTKYFGCKYHDFCRVWSNPLQRLDEVPTGFKVEHWNPMDEDSNAKHIFNLPKEGEPLT